MSPCTLRCSPDWCTGGTNVTGASYSLSVVTGPDTANAVTTAVSVAEATQEDDVSYTGSGYVRFILKAEAEGAVVGSTLVQDVSFGVTSSDAEEAAAWLDERLGDKLTDSVIVGTVVFFIAISVIFENLKRLKARADRNAEAAAIKKAEEKKEEKK